MSIHLKTCGILYYPKPVRDFKVRVCCTHLTVRWFIKIRLTPKQTDEWNLEDTNPQSCPLAKAQMNWIEITVGYHLASRSLIWSMGQSLCYGSDPEYPSVWELVQALHDQTGQRGRNWATYIYKPWQSQTAGSEFIGSSDSWPGWLNTRVWQLAWSSLSSDFEWIRIWLFEVRIQWNWKGILLQYYKLPISSCRIWATIKSFLKQHLQQTTNSRKKTHHHSMSSTKTQQFRRYLNPYKEEAFLTSCERECQVLEATTKKALSHIHTNQVSASDGIWMAHEGCV